MTEVEGILQWRWNAPTPTRTGGMDAAATRAIRGILSRGTGTTIADLTKQRDALRMLPLPIAQGLADDLQRRIDALEGEPARRAREARETEAHGARMTEFQARQQERAERAKDREAHRKRLEAAASGKLPMTLSELMRDRQGLLAEQRRLEDRFDLTEDERQSRMSEIDDELRLVGREIAKARRRAGRTRTPAETQLDTIAAQNPNDPRVETFRREYQRLYQTGDPEARQKAAKRALGGE